MDTKKKKLIRVEIDRREWFRGKPRGSALLRRDGMKCCLGFACLALGLPESKIRDKKMSYDVKVKEPINGLTEPSHFNLTRNITTNFTSIAANLNDNPSLPDRSREKELKQAAIKAGFRFIFTH